MDWKVGDTVRLKSGGPKMTVVGVGDNLGEPVVWCEWFYDNKKDSGTFPPAALEEAKSLRR